MIMTLSDLSSMIPYLYSGILIKMSRKNNDHTKKPWEKTFEEIKDDKEITRVELAGRAINEIRC